MRQTVRPVYFCVLLFMSLVSANFASADDTVTILSYDDAVDIALEKSYTVLSHKSNLQAMRHSFEYYRAQFKPKLDFGLFAPSLNENVMPIARPDGLPVYNSTGLLQAGGNLRFTYMLPTGGNLSLLSELYREDVKTVLALQNFQTLKNKQASSSMSLHFEQPIFTRNTLHENLLRAEYQYEKTSNVFTRSQMDIIYNVTNSFYFLYQAVRTVEIANERLANSEEAFRIAKLKYESGRIPEGDVLIAEVEMSRNRAGLLESKGSLLRLKDRFSQSIGLDAELNFEISADLSYEAVFIDIDKAVGEALKNRLEITETELDIQLQEINVDRARREREFKGNISAYYDLTGVSTITGNTTDMFNSSFDNFIDRPPNRGITLTFSYPVFDWGRGAARIQEESVRLKGRKLDLENTQRTISREVKDVCRRVEETAARLEIHEKNQEIARRSYDISSMQFENGDITSQELGREQERLADSQLQYLEAFIAYKLALADLKRKTMWDFNANRSYLVNTYFQEK